MHQLNTDVHSCVICRKAAWRVEIQGLVCLLCVAAAPDFPERMPELTLQVPLQHCRPVVFHHATVCPTMIQWQQSQEFDPGLCSRYPRVDLVFSGYAVGWPPNGVVL